MVQSVSVTSPAIPLAVRETITQLQGDLGDRAEELRQLMVAMRPPVARSGGDSALGGRWRPMLELYEEPTRTVAVYVDPGLELDQEHDDHRLPHQAGGPAQRCAPPFRREAWRSR